MLEFFFDCSSHWTYLAFHNIQPLVKQYNVPITYRPVLVGGIFNAVNPSVYNSRNDPVPAKQRYSKKDMQDWARSAGLKIKMPPTVFPVNAVKSMRGCILMDKEGKLLPFATACFEAYFGDDRDISQDAVLRDICAAVDIDADWLLEGAARPDIKDALRANVDELIARGGFGSPTIFVDKTDMYFGNDRIPLIREALAQRKEHAAGE